ncbi:MAG TPA: hypothetical protein ENN45_05455 [Bacteroidetes bacterium]|nr:hypothetical protein [Bacteroidota bacterium]
MEILEILKYVLPAIIVFLTAYFMLRIFFQKEMKDKDRQLMTELKDAKDKRIVPLRLQAYERLILLMERISPNQLLMRTKASGLSAKQYQSILLQTIRSEFEHNLAQQMYISSAAWDFVINAKEEMVKVINTAASQLKENASAHELSTLILEKSLAYKKFPTMQATEILKKEVRQLF